MKRLRTLWLLPLVAILGGCHAVVLDPAGNVAAQQRDLLIQSTLLMLLIIVPVISLTAFFAWRYRAGNKNARYEPDWDHSTKLELVIWSGPLLIIICLGALTWLGTHLLDPYRPLSQVAPGRSAAEAGEPLQVQVVAMDWKWLFIYPQYGVATVNELAAPVDRPIEFSITSSAVMNSFYIPALAGQIYAMPGMQTKLHAVANRIGTYEGISANYSGAGFSGMHFGFEVLSSADFDAWVTRTRAVSETLDRASYLKLEQPSENEPVHRYGTIEAGLFKAAVGMCIEASKMCTAEMMKIDAQGGLGLAGVYNVSEHSYDKFLRRGAAPVTTKRFVVGLCASDDLGYVASSSPVKPVDEAPLLGRGLPVPGGLLSIARLTAFETVLPQATAN
ncbi:MAG: ubiquinol oxidase subunit II [Steroidobacteraceae bacterium]